MNIFVNNEKLDATIEKADTIADVYNQIDGWLRQNDRYILSLKVDNREISTDEIDSLTAADRLDFVVGDEKDMVISTIHELDTYLDKAGSFLYEKETLNQDEVNQLVAGVEWIHQVLDSTAALTGIDFNTLTVPMPPDGHASDPIAVVREKLNTLCTQSGDWNRERIEEILEAMRPIKSFSMRLSIQLAAQHATLEDLSEAVQSFESILPEMVGDVARINELLQTGKEVEAMELLDTTSESLNDAISAMFALEFRCKQEGMQEIQNSEGKHFTDAAQTLLDTFRDLSDSLEENDIVAAGDILEYEITDQLTSLKPFLKELQDFVVASKN